MECFKERSHDGLKIDIKARLCLRGFKETVDRISKKILYNIAGNEGWSIKSIDVTSAFLQVKNWIDVCLLFLQKKQICQDFFGK